MPERHARVTLSYRTTDRLEGKVISVQTTDPPVLTLSGSAPVAPVPGPAQSVELAGWGRRFLAWLLDWILLLTISVVVGLPVALAIGDTNGEATGYMVAFLLSPVFFLYFALLNGRGRTVGKRALRISVVDGETLQPIGFGRGAVRELTRIGLWMLMWAPGFIDGLRPLWNDRRQSWHDSAARSIVTRG